MAKKITPAQAIEADRIITESAKTPAVKAEFTVTRKFVEEVKDASLAVMKHQGTAVAFFTMSKEAKDKYGLRLLQFLHFFDASIPAHLDAKATPKVDQKYIDSLPAYNRLRNLLRVGAAGTKRVVTAEARAAKANARKRALADVIRGSKMSKEWAKKLLAILDTSTGKGFTGDVLGLVWPTTVEDVKGEAKTA